MPQQLIVTNTQDNGSGSLREAIALAQSGDTIKFSSSIAGKTLTLSTGQLEIRPGKNITIDGADAPGLTISGNKESRIFYVNSNQDFNASLTLKNLDLINGYTNERGGAIEITHQGALTVDNVQFKNNVADNGGGAIYSAWETDLIVNASTFDNNKAVAGNDERGAGAIAFVSPGEITVTNSEFTNNQGINGGAINSLQGKLTIENSTFLNNHTTAAFYDTGNKNPFLRGYGGAVYTDRASNGSDSTSGTIQIIDSVFEGNKGRGEGGAAYLYTGTQDNVIIEGSLFENNEVLALPNGGNNGNGGAVVQLSNGLNKGLVVRDTTFANNTAANQGGGLWTYDAPAKIINSTFSGNQTTGDTARSVGGGMTLYSPTQIIDSTIAYNNASWVGGGVSAGKNADVSVKNTIFYENTADNGTNDWGIQQHTNKELTDKGGNVQYPPKATNNWNDYNATAKIRIIDAQLSPLQDNGGSVPTHTVGNPDITAGAFFEDSGSTGGDDVTNNDPTLVSPITDQTVEAEDSFSLDITNNFTDADGDNLTYSATLADGTALPSWLTFDSQTGTFSGTPDTGDETQLNILVTANDGQGGTQTDGFELDITPASVVNNDPTLVSPIADQTVEAEDAFSLDITNNFTDADGDNLTYSATLADGTALPSWLTFDSQTGTFSGTPDTGDETQLNILVTANDGQGGTQTDGFELDITPAPVVNNDPTLVSPIADQTVEAEDSFSLDITNNFSDADGDNLSYSATLADGNDLPSWLTFDSQTGTFSGTPDTGDETALNILVTASDGQGGTQTDGFELDITPAPVVNNDPTLVSPIADQTVEAEDSFSLDITNNFTDVDGDSLTYSATLADGNALPDWLSFDSQTGTFSGTPDAGDETQLNILVTASDGQGGTQTDGFELDITPAPVVNNDPTLVSPIADQTVEAEDSFSLDITNNFSDADGDNLTYSATLADGNDLPSWLSFDSQTGTFSGTPDTGDETALNILVTASDGQGGTQTDGFELDITPAPVVNNDPTLVSPIADQTVEAEDSFSLDISDYFTDADGDTLTFSATGLPKGLNLNPDTGVISGTPRNKGVGTNSITLTANDGNGGEISDVFDLTVNRGTRNNGNAKPKLKFNNDLLFLKGNSQANNLLFTLTGNNSPFVSEVGIFEVDNAAGNVNGIKPGETGYLQAALNEGNVLFSSLPNNFAGDNLTRILDVEQVFGETTPNLGFYLVQNSTTDNVRAALDAGQTPTNVWFSLPGANANSTDYFEVLNGDNNQFTLNWQNSMAESNDTLTLTVEPTNESPALGTQLQGERELIDLRGQTNPVDANFIEIKSHAGFDNSVGLYVIENEEGAVEDPMTGQLIYPEDEGYAQAALAQSVVSDVNRGMATFDTQLEGGSLLAPYIIANGTTEEWFAENSNNQYLGYGEPIAYFAHLGANPDGVDHIRLLGDNTFGFEDLYGGGDQDFNDFTFQVDLTVA